MKTIFTLLILVVCFTANAQKRSDTLEIKDTAIHFIKVGGKVYEIRRNVDLVEVNEKPKVEEYYKNTYPFFADTLSLRVPIANHYQ